MEEGIANRLKEQVKIFRDGIPRYELSAAARIDFGIKKFTSQEQDNFEQIFSISEKIVEKFIPASGAATRMFRDLLAVKNSGKPNESSKFFFSNLDNIPLKIDAVQESEILEELFEQKKIDQRPKGLLQFHSYETYTRSAAEEHLAEGVGYAEKQGKVRLHFTVSPEHLEDFKTHLEKASSHYPSNFEISFSIQNPETDTVAVDLDNVPVKDTNDELLFRPAGHGALLENLNQRTADLIFIKNIDNVVPDRLKAETIKYKKVLAGVLLYYQEKVFDLLNKNEKGESISKEGSRLLQELGMRGNFSDAEVAQKLNRPIRVCGMVKNEGEPGGGPFWVKTKEGLESLQIVESAQIDLNDSAQQKIFKQSTHFNPVDLVCGVKDYKGKKFNLLEYRDPNTGFIAEKSYNDQSIKALELPGLWNGGMADWNTIFVEVPLITFNPVKTINDLLRPEHQA